MRNSGAGGHACFNFSLHGLLRSSVLKQVCRMLCRAVLAEGPAIIYNVPGRTGGLLKPVSLCAGPPACCK